MIGGFLFLYLITGDFNTVSEQALILIGIGIDTALGAAPEDKQALSDLSVQLSQKTAELNETIKKINEASSGLNRPESEGLLKDLLSDVNGVNFHRFQMVIWTIVLAVLFFVGVYSTLAMPQFSNTLLALMGISSGTCLGFKIPERQT